MEDASGSSEAQGKQKHTYLKSKNLRWRLCCINKANLKNASQYICFLILTGGERSLSQDFVCNWLHTFSPPQRTLSSATLKPWQHAFIFFLVETYFVSFRSLAALQDCYFSVRQCAGQLTDSDCWLRRGQCSLITEWGKRKLYSSAQ